MPDREMQATSGYKLVASGLKAKGVVGVPLSCGSSGDTRYYTVKIVATNALASTEAFFWGAIGPA
jgi:hypothetical protein